MNLPKALVLQDECFGKNYLSFLDFTRNYEQTSGILPPAMLWALARSQCPGSMPGSDKSHDRQNKIAQLQTLAPVSLKQFVVILTCHAIQFSCVLVYDYLMLNFDL